MTQAIRPMPEEMPVELWRGFKPNNAGCQGSVGEIFVAPEAAAEMVALTEVRAFADGGLEGDRFCHDCWKAVNRSDKAVSLIEDEVLQRAAQELGVATICQ